MADSKSLDGQMLVDAIGLEDAGEAMAEVRRLLDSGCSPDERKSDGCGPLETATAAGRWRVAELLLDAGATALTPADDLFHPLIQSAMSGPRKLVERLLGIGYAWDDTIRQHERHWAHTDHESLLRPSSREYAEELLFDQLLSAGSRDRLPWLCELGALRHIDVFDEDIGTNTLGCRVRDRDIESVRWLLEHGAWVNPLTTFDINFLPIDRAVLNHDLSMTRLLIEHGANPNIRNWMNCNAVDRARQSAEKVEHADAKEIYDMVSMASANFPMID